MRLLLDTHVLLALLGSGSVVLSSRLRDILADDKADLAVSTASLWEIAIKVRATKLDFGMPLSGLPAACNSAGLSVLPIEPAHVLYDLQPLPTTRDPFDRLLLAQAGVTGMRTGTIDRALTAHPLAWTG